MKTHEMVAIVNHRLGKQQPEKQYCLTHFMAALAVLNSLTAHSCWEEKNPADFLSPRLG